MSAPQRKILALVLTAATSVAATGLGACGDGNTRSDKLLPRATASELRSTLASVEQSTEDGDCVGAEAQARSLQQQVGTLSSKVDAELRDALADGAARLQRLVVNDCESQTGATGPTGPSPQVPEEDASTKEGKGKQKPEKPGKAKGQEKNQSDEDSGGIQITPDTGGGGQGGTGEALP